jgi:hypothetical protein
MWEGAGPKRARLGLITAAAAVIAVLLMVLTGLNAPGAAPQAKVTATGAGVAVFPLLANTTIDLNRTQSSGTYVPEYVSLNNSTTLTQLPAVLTVVAKSCRWVSVLNLTVAAKPASAFHNVQYRNVTTGNATGTVIAPTYTTSFLACGAHYYSVNFVYWTYSIYEFSASGLIGNSNLTVGGISHWPGTSIGPKNRTVAFGQTETAVLVIASNLTFTVILPSPVNGTTSCDYTKQVCSYTQYKVSTAADVVNVTTASTIAFTKASGLLVTATYENWTVTYTSSTVNANTGLGAFFSNTYSALNSWVYAYWWAWVVVVLILIIIGFAARGRRRPKA